MGFESLRHTPEFELPQHAPSAPADLSSLIEECYEGLSKAIVSKMIRRGKYDQVAQIICQDNPSKKTTPAALADDIADYCMMCMQYDVDKTDEPSTYKVTLVGPPGRGRFERSKHVDLGEGDGMARSKTMMTEGELIEQQSTYIGELHQHSIANMGILQDVVKPLLTENKEMMKIISESTRRLAEVERDRMKFELEMRMHNDEVEMRKLEDEEKTRRWRETMDVIKESGAVEGLMKAIAKKMNAPKKDASPNRKMKANVNKNEDGDVDQPEDDNKNKKKTKKSRVEKAKKSSNRKSKNKSKKVVKKDTESEAPAGANGEMTQDQLEEEFLASGISKAQENPIALTVEVLRMSIEENDQWRIIEETLSGDQFDLFKRIMDTDSDDEIRPMLKNLYEMKGARRFMVLEEHLDEDQQRYINALLEIAVNEDD